MSTGGPPQMKAVLVRSTLEDIERSKPALGERIRNRMRPESIEQLEAASRVGYVPVEVDVDLTEALFTEAGTELACDTLRAGIADSLSGPLFGSVVSTARAVLGGSLAKLLKWSPRVWTAIYRDAGEIVIEQLEDGHATLVIEDLPLSVCRSDCYLRGTAAAIGGIFDVVGTQGNVELVGPDLATRRATFHLRWRTSED